MMALIHQIELWSNPVVNWALCGFHHGQCPCLTHSGDALFTLFCIHELHEGHDQLINVTLIVMGGEACHLSHTQSMSVYYYIPPPPQECMLNSLLSFRHLQPRRLDQCSSARNREKNTKVSVAPHGSSVFYKSYINIVSDFAFALNRYSEGEIRFSLMAIVSDRKTIYERKIAELQAHLTEVGDFWHEMLFLAASSFFKTRMFLRLQEEPMDTDQSANLLSSIQSEIAKYQLLIEEENQKLKRYKVRPLSSVISYSWRSRFISVSICIATECKIRLWLKKKSPRSFWVFFPIWNFI